jgi:Tol biopolymer transport system component
LLLTGLVGGLVTAPGAVADEQARLHPFRGNTDWVAYQTFRDGREGTWLVHPDGTGDHPILTDLGRVAILPDWSPDGRRLAVSTRGGDSEPLFEHDLATGETTQIFDCEFPCLGDDEPAYSPDGTQMAFVRYQAPFTEDWVPVDCALWIGDLATDQLTRVTSDADCDRPYGPRWSPDGQWLTYHRERPAADGDFESAIFTIRRDGSGERRLTGWRRHANPDWSRDGRWIVFSTGFAGDRSPDLVRIRPDGSDRELLADYVGTGATQPRYTPDGDWIVFTALKPLEGWPRQRSLWAIPADGGPRVVIAHTERIYTHGTWQPS